MPVKNAATDVLAAVGVMTRARYACAPFDPPSDAMTPHQLQQRADRIDKVIRARVKLQQLRNRAAAIEEALARFKARRMEQRA
jgi:hypothetical protein